MGLAGHIFSSVRDGRRGVCDGDHRLDVMKSSGSGAGAAGASYPDTIRLRSSVFPLARLGEVVW
jgi:hypothetical protein